MRGDGATGNESAASSSADSAAASTPGDALDGGGNVRRDALHITQTIVQCPPQTAMCSGCATLPPPPRPPFINTAVQTPAVADDAEMRPNTVPLVKYVSEWLKCAPEQIGDRLRNPQKRRDLLKHLRDCFLYTTHLKPEWRNMQVHCHDLSSRGASLLPAYRGFMDVKVAQHYYIRHRIRLTYPHLPCIVQLVGHSAHKSYFNMEVLCVLL